MTRHPRPRLLGPSRLAPVAVDLNRVFWAGIAVWAVALAVALVGALQDRVHWETVATCVAGVLLGFVALDWERRRRRRAGRPAGDVTDGSAGPVTDAPA